MFDINKLHAEVVEKIEGTLLDGHEVHIDSETSLRIETNFDGVHWIGVWNLVGNNNEGDNEPDAVLIVDTWINQCLDAFDTDSDEEEEYEE